MRKNYTDILTLIFSRNWLVVSSPSKMDFLKKFPLPDKNTYVKGIN